MTNLEQRVVSPHLHPLRSIAHRYIVDTTAAWLFYTPLMALSEHYVASMDSREVLHSRLYAAGVHALIMRPYGQFRQWWADYWHANGSSPFLKKLSVDTSAAVMFQLPAYSAILYASGASFKEIAVALPAGLAIGTLTGRPFGYVLDKWRKLWRTKPTLDM